MRPVRISLSVAMSGFLLVAFAWGAKAQDSLNESKRALPPLRIGWEVMQAKMLHKSLPKYPEAARQQNLTGAIRLDILVGKDGSVEGIKALSGDALLADPVTTDIKAWQFQPTLLGGHPVEVVSEIDLEFQLHKGKTKVICTNERPARLP